MVLSSAHSPDSDKLQPDPDSESKHWVIFLRDRRLRERMRVEVLLPTREEIRATRRAASLALSHEPLAAANGGKSTSGDLP